MRSIVPTQWLINSMSSLHCCKSVVLVKATRAESNFARRACSVSAATAVVSSPPDRGTDTSCTPTPPPREIEPWFEDWAGVDRRGAGRVRGEEEPPRNTADARSPSRPLLLTAAGRCCLKSSTSTASPKMDVSAAVDAAAVLVLAAAAATLSAPAALAEESDETLAASFSVKTKASHPQQNVLPSRLRVRGVPQSCTGQVSLSSAHPCNICSPIFSLQEVSRDFPPPPSAPRPGRLNIDEVEALTVLGVAAAGATLLGEDAAAVETGADWVGATVGFAGAAGPPRRILPPTLSRVIWQSTQNTSFPLRLRRSGTLQLSPEHVSASIVQPCSSFSDI